MAMIIDLISDLQEIEATGERVYPVMLPENFVLPAITTQIPNSKRTLTSDGPDPLANANVIVNCWGDTYADSWNLAEAVRIRLNGYRGTLGETTVQKIEVENIGDTEGVFFEAADQMIFPVTVSLIVDFLEPQE